MATNESDTFKIVCLFARERGINVLEGLLNDKRFTIVGLWQAEKEIYAYTNLEVRK